MADESIWKKEITLGRKKKPQPEAASTAPGDDAQVPFWKKEIGGKKKGAAPAVAAAAAPDVPKKTIHRTIPAIGSARASITPAAQSSHEGNSSG